MSITATDPSGATDTLMVTVMVEDVDDKPVISVAGGETCELDGDTIKCTYEENGMGPAANLSVADDEGDATTWSLEESGDYKKFSISADGVLTFMSPPDFDSPGDEDKDNVYKVTVLADGGERADGERAVEVTVTDLNESGEVTFLGNQQPQVGESMAADLKDEDGSVVRLSWQWSKGPSMEGPWEDVSSATGSYTPKAADIDSYLRAMVSYTDVEYDAPDTVEGVTKFAVRDRPSANAAPKFSAQSIEVFENTDGAIGTVTASDDDELIFSMAMGAELDLDGDDDNDDNDNGSFMITDSGELTLVAELDYEQPSDGALNSNTDDDDTDEIVEYTAIVTATDPSGASGSGAVIVHLLNVDEAPEVTSSADDDEAEVDEGEDITAITFTADDDADPEGGTIAANGLWELEGADAAKFTLDGGSLTFMVADGADDAFRPNFEDPKDANGDNVYEVTVVVPVIDSVKPGKRSVEVTVIDIEDDGKLEIAAREPQVGASVSGTLTDEDGGVRDRVWQWYRGVESDGDIAVTDLVALNTVDAREGNLCDADNAATSGDPCVIDKAESSTYTTTSDDGGFLIHLVVSYTDAFDSEDGDDTDTATLMARPVRAVQDPPAVNAAPKFGIQDRELDGDDDAPEQVTRNVDEGTKAVAEFEATDTELLVYDLGGADGGMFSLEGPSDEDNEVTLSLKDAPDFENPADADGDNAYEVSITATDPSGATDTLMVTVMVDDVDDKPVITLGPGTVQDPDSECVTGGAVASASYAGLTADCEALLASEDALVGDGTGLNWDAGTPISEWNGVIVDGDPMRVTNIYLKGHGLAGMIPATIGDLDGLVKLQLHDNDLTGPIPAELGNLSSLEWLILYRNAFTGGIPAELGNLSNLDILWLYSNDNDLTGGIPSELGNLTSLRRLYLHDNGLTGEIPSELGNMASLRYLILSRNELTGSIPTELGGLTDLKALYLYMNDLTGDIPDSLGNMVDADGESLRILYLHKNMLTGSIPASLGSLTALTNLWLNGNMLSGDHPVRSGQPEQPDKVAAERQHADRVHTHGAGRRVEQRYGGDRPERLRELERHVEPTQRTAAAGPTGRRGRHINPALPQREST